MTRSCPRAHKPHAQEVADPESISTCVPRAVREEEPACLQATAAAHECHAAPASSYGQSCVSMHEMLSPHQRSASTGVARCAYSPLEADVMGAAAAMLACQQKSVVRDLHAGCLACHPSERWRAERTRQPEALHLVELLRRCLGHIPDGREAAAVNLQCACTSPQSAFWHSAGLAGCAVPVQHARTFRAPYFSGLAPKPKKCHGPVKHAQQILHEPFPKPCGAVPKTL